MVTCILIQMWNDPCAWSPSLHSFWRSLHTHPSNYTCKSVLTLNVCNYALWLQPSRCTCARSFSRLFKWVSSRNIPAQRRSRECPSRYRTRLLLAVPLNFLFVTCKVIGVVFKMITQHQHKWMTVVGENHNLYCFVVNGWRSLPDSAKRCPIIACRPLSRY